MRVSDVEQCSLDDSGWTAVDESVEKACSLHEILDDNAQCVDCFWLWPGAMCHQLQMGSGKKSYSIGNAAFETLRTRLTRMLVVDFAMRASEKGACSTENPIDINMPDILYVPEYGQGKCPVNVDTN